MDDQNPTSENVPSAAAAAGNDVSMTDAPTVSDDLFLPTAHSLASLTLETGLGLGCRGRAGQKLYIFREAGR